MDHAPIRRGKPTVHEKWNKSTAVLSGDVMQSYSYRLLDNLPNEIVLPILRFLNIISIGVCEGQQLDMNFENKKEVSVNQYLKMIELKTSVLLGASLKIGAMVAQAPEDDIERLYKFGKNMGIAFQIRDDILDVFGDEKKVGKRTGGDIVSNKKTILLLYAYELANSAQKKELDYLTNHSHSIPNEEKITRMKEVYRELNVQQKAEQLIQNYYSEALQQIHAICSTCYEKETIINFFSKLIGREY